MVKHVPHGVDDLELTVRAGCRQSSTNVRFALESDLKIGHFSFSEQDLVLPVNGLPLTITRTYNSLNLKKVELTPPATPVEAHFANKELADAVREAIGSRFPSLKVVHTPATTVIP